jgi:hypothetical protein
MNLPQHRIDTWLTHKAHMQVAKPNRPEMMQENSAAKVAVLAVGSLTVG